MFKNLHFILVLFISFYYFDSLVAIHDHFKDGLEDSEDFNLRDVNQVTRFRYFLVLIAEKIKFILKLGS